MRILFILLLLINFSCKSNRKANIASDTYSLTIEKGDSADFKKVFHQEIFKKKLNLYFSNRIFHTRYDYDKTKKTIYLKPINNTIPSLGMRDQQESKYSIDVDTISLNKLKITLQNLKVYENNIVYKNRLLNPPLIILATKTKH